jgi:hypothetical protein
VEDMISIKEFRKLLDKKGRLQEEYSKLENRRKRLLATVDDLDDDLSSIAQDITDITQAMGK